MIELRASKIKCVNGGNGLTAVSTLINAYMLVHECVRVQTTNTQTHFGMRYFRLEEKETHLQGPSEGGNFDPSIEMEDDNEK